MKPNCRRHRSRWSTLPHDSKAVLELFGRSEGMIKYVRRKVINVKITSTGVM